MFDESNKQCIAILLTVVIVFMLIATSKPRRNYQMRRPMQRPMQQRIQLRQGQQIDTFSDVIGEVQEAEEAGSVPPTNQDTVPLVSEVSVSGPSCSAGAQTPYVNAGTGILIDSTAYDSGLGSRMRYQTGGNIPSNYYFLDDGANGEMSVENNIVSKSCCGASWPTPFQQNADPYVCGNKDEFVQSRMFGNNTYQDSGCLCVSKKQSEFLYNRGNNARGWF